MAVRQASPAVSAAAVGRRPGAVEQAVDLRRPEAVRLLVGAGLSIHGTARTTPLHLAAYNGDLPMVRLLVSLGADPRREDPEYHSTPLGWAEHAGADEVADYLRSGQRRPLSQDQASRPTRSSWLRLTTSGRSRREWYPAYGMLPSRTAGTPTFS